MKFTIMMKTPDVIDQLEPMGEDELEQVKDLINKYLRYGELAVLEFDTEEQSCRVLGAL